MNQDFIVSIIGYGYVGSAFGNLCKKNGIQFNICDTQIKEENLKYFKNIEDLFIENTSNDHFIVISVPTPSDQNGNCDTSIVQSILEKINSKLSEQGIISKNTFVIIKSTVVPGTCQKLEKIFPNINIIFCPEFLREVLFKEDMYNAKFVLVGLPYSFQSEKTNLIEKMFRRIYSHNPNIDIIIKTYEECELFKYTLNVYFSVKIWYFNEIYQICEKIGVNYDSLRDIFKLDQRVGDYGTMVPGYDGKLSFGGSCLPKETRGMIKLQENLEIPNDVLTSLLKRSDFLRKK